MSPICEIRNSACRRFVFDLRRSFDRLAITMEP